MKRVILLYLLIMICICGCCGCGGKDNKEVQKQNKKLSKAEVGDVVLFGTYEQDGISSNGAEEIPWYVLDKDGDKVLLMSVYLLDAVPYHVGPQIDGIEITWEDCTLRQWMNDDFYNSAFTEAEKKQILTSHLKNADNSYYETEGGNDTEDKVFALSLEEAVKYFGIAEYKSFWWYSASPELSAAKVTKYAESQGAYADKEESTAGNGAWFLRTPGEGGNTASVRYNGDINVSGMYAYFAGCVRPAMWVSLNPSVTTSAAAEAPTPATHTIYDEKTLELLKAKEGDVVLFGSYEQDNIASNGAEAIQWYVLGKDGDNLLLMSVYLLDAVPYLEEDEDTSTTWEDTRITWEDCMLRQWMNDVFYNSAFTESEKKYIRTSYLENADNPYSGTEGGNDTEDKVFALSLAEAEQYFGIAKDVGYYWYSASPELSAAKGTTYAEAQGVCASTYEPTAGNACWWLRSPGDSKYGACAAYVNAAGGVDVDGAFVFFRDLAARPALWLNLSP